MDKFISHKIIIHQKNIFWTHRLTDIYTTVWRFCAFLKTREHSISSTLQWRRRGRRQRRKPQLSHSKNSSLLRPLWLIWRRFCFLFFVFCFLLIHSNSKSLLSPLLSLGLSIWVFVVVMIIRYKLSFHHSFEIKAFDWFGILHFWWIFRFLFQRKLRYQLLSVQERLETWILLKRGVLQF